MDRNAHGFLSPARALLPSGEQMLDLYDQAAGRGHPGRALRGLFRSLGRSGARLAPLPHRRRSDRPRRAAAPGPARRHHLRGGARAASGTARRCARPAAALDTRICIGSRASTLKLEQQFNRRAPGSESDLHALYQGIYLERLKQEERFVLDEGEAAIERARLTRTPLSHAQAGAEALSMVEVAADPRLEVRYRIELTARPAKRRSGIGCARSPSGRSRPCWPASCSRPATTPTPISPGSGPRSGW